MRSQVDNVVWTPAGSNLAFDRKRKIALSRAVEARRARLTRTAALSLDAECWIKAAIRSCYRIVGLLRLVLEWLFPPERPTSVNPISQSRYV